MPVMISFPENSSLAGRPILSDWIIICGAILFSPALFAIAPIYHSSLLGMTISMIYEE
jgi:hypothetical protein